MSLSRIHVPLMQFPRIYIYPDQGIENKLIPTSTCIPRDQCIENTHLQHKLLLNQN